MAKDKEEMRVTTIARIDSSAVVKEVAEIFDIKDNLEGVTPRLPQIVIKHGAEMFAFPDESKSESFDGFIVDFVNCNAYWDKAVDEGGGDEPPRCASPDGIAPNTDDPISASCAGCAKNQFGSSQDGSKGKACKNMRRLHIYLDSLGETVPYRLTVPPSSLRAVDEYLTVLTSKGLPYRAVRTVFSLEPMRKGGMEWSALKLRHEGVINTKEDAEMILRMKQTFLAAMRYQEVRADEYGNGSVAADHPANKDSVNKDLPF